MWRSAQQIGERGRAAPTRVPPCGERKSAHAEQQRKKADGCMQQPSATGAKLVQLPRRLALPAGAREACLAAPGARVDTLHWCSQVTTPNSPRMLRKYDSCADKTVAHTRHCSQFPCQYRCPCCVHGRARTSREQKQVCRFRFALAASALRRDAAAEHSSALGAARCGCAAAARPPPRGSAPMAAISPICDELHQQPPAARA